MKSRTPIEHLSDARIRQILEETERQALGGRAGAIARAGLGTLALVLAIYATTESQAETLGLIMLCGIFILGLTAYIRSIARSLSKRGPSVPPANPKPVPPVIRPAPKP